MPSFADRLRAAHQNRFVGREGELDAFEHAIDADVPPFAVLYIHGPGGVGKTALTQEMQFRCADRSVSVCAVDARNVEPTPQAAEKAIEEAGLDLSVDPSAPDSMEVLFVDTFEAWTPLYEWFRSNLIPRLPASLIVVLSGRTPPPASWRSDLGLEPLLKIQPLRNLPRRLGERYLDRRGIEGDVRERILGFSHGHPLALSLAADAVAQGADANFDPIDSPDLVGTLVRRFLERVPSDRHRQALEACALVRVCSEPLLSTLLKGTDDGGSSMGYATGNGTPERLIGAHDLFTWLRQLSFIETSSEGIFPHDIVRTAIAADLRWRDHDRFDRLQQRARTHYLDALDDATSTQTVGTDAGNEAQGILTDYLYLFRHNPVVRPFFQRLRNEWNARTPPVRDAATSEDRGPLRKMVAQNENEASAECFEHWWNHDASTVHVFRDDNTTPAGFLMQIDLSAVTEKDRDADPAVEAACSFLETDAPLRKGEIASHFRFWMARDSYQDISPVQSLISAYRVRYYLSTPGLAYTFIPAAKPEQWELLFAYGDMHRVSAADFSVGDDAYAVFGHDWRVVPPQAWLDRLADRDLSPAMPEPASASPTMIVLSRSDFDDAVKEAFKAHARPEAMHDNPLLRSRLIAEATGLDASADERIEALRTRLDEAAYSLDSDPKTAKYYRAVRATYLNPQPTQERAAEHLNLAFSTYRRYLKRGIQHVADLLWRDEVGDRGEND
ncbi:AAA family ATPase [Longibacter salinarum]|uniref:AAA family ATPase n=1 Tax=Longibacter salinarum TaxID=1850348 RepID=A0A2A8D021_9BACT|nr:ATP-binding protein [Longibacter salinarum]PEN14329.1 AAA family ATPase [Longibacter salinarum]